MKRDKVYAQALKEFHRYWGRILKSDFPEPTAMVLATADPSGQPSVRTVLLKEATEKGFVFYTNLRSRKGAQLKHNPKAALCFYWEQLERQVVVEGPVRPVSRAEADAYWKSRPRESQVSAWASNQSLPLKNRAELLRRSQKILRKFAGKPIPRPSHWSGFRVVPRRIEFWKRRPHRLNERRLFFKSAAGWRMQLLNP